MKYDAIIIGAGAAGLMCALTAAKRGKRVLVLDHTNKAGKKILMSGGGRCNFTNYNISYEKYLSNNPHFFKSALNQYTQWDFIELVNSYQIPYYEKTQGQLFCKNKSRDILNMLLSECKKYGVTIKLNTKVYAYSKLSDNHFQIVTNEADLRCHALVIACGGLSIPTMGASGFGYKIAEHFGLSVIPTKPALVPFVLDQDDMPLISQLPGVALPVTVDCGKQSFSDDMLFTHKGLSGPAILQISSYWQQGHELNINLVPHIELSEHLEACKVSTPDKALATILNHVLPKNLTKAFIANSLLTRPLKQLQQQDIQLISQTLSCWRISPKTTEGYKVAEVTLGGVDVNQVSSKTMACHEITGLYFIGEVLDVTGWLGGYNFQWAWSSGYVAGINL